MSSTRISTWSISVVLVAVALAIGVYLLLHLLTSSESARLYRLVHGALNTPVPPPTMWLNMGYWELSQPSSIVTPQAPRKTFQAACTDLLRNLLVFADVLPEDVRPVRFGMTRLDSMIERNADAARQRKVSLLDVGIGCGEQALTLFDLLGAQLVNYVGITDVAGEASFARDRVNARLADTRMTTPCRMIYGNAADPNAWRHHLPEAPSDAETWLLALDCAYHFRPSRSALLNYAQHELEANYMAFDILLADNASTGNKLLLCCLCPFLGTPFSNFLTLPQYKDMLASAGYPRDSIDARNVTAHVFSGLVDFMEYQDVQLKRYGLGGLSMPLRVAKWVFEWWRDQNVVRAYYIVARRAKSDGELQHDAEEYQARLMREEQRIWTRGEEFDLAYAMQCERQTSRIGN